MARQRGQQKGYVHRQGDVWYLAYREDALDDNGKLIRIRRNVRIADAKGGRKTRSPANCPRGILAKVDERAVMPLSLVTVSGIYRRRGSSPM